MCRSYFFVLAATLALVLPAHAEEQMLLTPPKGFKVVAESSTEKTKTAVMVPQGQSAANWTERLSTQLLFKQVDEAPEVFRARAEKAALAECPGATFEKLKGGTENLYPMAAWIETCAKPKDGGGMLQTWTKAVQGRENFYVLQKSHRFAPDAKQLKALTKLFDAARVCDTRVPGQRCKQK
ncbi:hypothetical protein LPW26_15475 [Rhodopseudomonas sp. HC1]|uniref:hypothetical protein n=1 Tax=Rhodopseudomonas infernalis TaxID=2897386 RepID=UPI001EE964AC|nr:hypothetical protein [Rhodopseudomonas infernalis]MCG6206050.1 hypothetical protein [Rhodopseudomonas infernalis]